MLSLQWGDLRARVDPHGAELRSLRRGDDEFLWQDEARVWPHSAPLLFPFVGRLREARYLYAGREYRMGIHGFAAGMDFELVEQTAASVKLLLASNASTRAGYPFDFRLYASFSLDDAGLGVRYEVHNDGDRPMAFGLGSHPALAVDASDLAAWSLVFDQAEAPEVYRLAGNLLSERPEPLAFMQPGGRSLQLGAQLFERDALIFKRVASHRISLVHVEHGTRATVHTGGAPQLGLWAVPGAGFVCIEPWFGVDEDARAPMELMRKPDLVRLPPGGRFASGYRIEPGASRP